MALRDRTKGMPREHLHPQGIKAKEFVEWVHDLLIEHEIDEAHAYDVALEVWREARLKGT